MFVRQFCVLLLCFALASCSSNSNNPNEFTFFDNFEDGLAKWELNNPAKLHIIESGDIDLVINTVDSQVTSIRDSASIRRSALLRGIPYCTTVAGARASVGAILAMQTKSIGVRTLQEIHSDIDS